jgi:hypothetical protein
MEKVKKDECPKGGRHEPVSTVIPGTKKCKKCGKILTKERHHTKRF